MPSGSIQQSPWLAIATKQLEIMRKYAAALGLSPVSRGRVAAFLRFGIGRPVIASFRGVWGLLQYKHQHPDRQVRWRS
ncbi:P27 family phage terminase small subunit [Mesorhizobium sp. IMUNJ 23232]|uniref:P27 family phage terminase small subunit n=1 Tax=Mesorhizobium sp. IMUNJ 23232 TaxID=3376064 RepID=UPI00378976F5